MNSVDNTQHVRQMQAVDSSENILQLNRDLQKVEKEIKDLKELGIDLQRVIQKDGENLNVVEQKTQTAAKEVMETVPILKKAAEHKSNERGLVGIILGATGGAVVCGAVGCAVAGPFGLAAAILGGVGGGFAGSQFKI